MRFWQYPTKAVDTTISYTCSAGVDFQSQNQTTLKEKLIGDPATGGAYNWGNMPLSLPFGIIEDATVSQCQAIGALCHDAGVANGAEYSSASGTSATTYNAGKTLKSVFYYSNCIDAQPTGNTFNGGTDLYNILNPNLDAGFPLIFGIYSPNEGHCIVCDGYGYESGTLYHHLNLGWSGNNNAWYELPDINTSAPNINDFPDLGDILYNTYPTGSGEIISGRVVDQNGKPLSGATVQAVIAGALPNITWQFSNAQGIFAFAYLASNTAYTITAASGTSSNSQVVQTATSTYGQPTSGDVWMQDITLNMPPSITGFNPTSGATGAVITISGCYFTGANAVTFGGTPATSFSVVNDTTIQATVGNGATGTITVTTPNGTATSSGTFTFIPPPTITLFTPGGGVAGTVVTISGTNFTGTTAVDFGGTPATSFSVLNDGTIHATVGTGAVGHITVTTPGGTATSFFLFFPAPTISSFTPTSGVAGTVVTISGTNFTGTNAVTFGGIGASSYTVTNDTTISATVGNGALGFVTVTTPGGTAISTTIFSFTGVGQGDWWMFRHDPQHTGCSPFIGPTSPVQRWTFSPGSLETSPAIAADGTIYVNVDDAELAAINPDGTQKWAFHLDFGEGPTGFLYSSPAVGTDGTIYVGAWNGTLYAINPNGMQKWALQIEYNDHLYSSPAIGPDGTIYLGAEDDNLYAISPNGWVKWAFQTSWIIDGSPAIGPDGTIYIGSCDGNLYALSPGGGLKWYISTGDNQIRSSPAIGADGTIYFESWDNEFYAVNPNGTQQWVLPIGFDLSFEDWIYSSPGIGPDGTLYVPSADGNLYALSKNGTQKWAFSLGGVIDSSPAIGGDGTIYTETGSGSIDAINPNGTLQWSGNTNDTGSVSPVIGADGTLYVGGFYGLCALVQSTPTQLQFGTQPGTTPMGAAISPAVTVLVLDANGKKELAANMPVTLALGANPGGATLGGTLTVNAVQGVATFNNLTIDRVGTGYTLIASAPGLTGVTSQPFTVLPMPTITSFTPSSGGYWTWVTIFGTNFTGAMSVYFGGYPAYYFIIDSDSQISALVWNGNSGPITVTAPGGTATSSNSFTYYPAPTITSFTPSSGGTGTLVTITGTGFTGTTAVTFGATTVSFMVIDDNTITVTLSSPASGTITVANPGGTATSAGAFTFTFPGAGPGDWWMFHHDIQHTGRSPFIGPASPELKWAYTTGGGIYSSPAFGADGTIYIGSWDGHLYAINPDDTYKWAWTCPTGWGINQSSPAIGTDGTIYVGSWDSNLYAIYPDGSQRWVIGIDGSCSSSPAIRADGTIYIGGYTDLYAINPDGTYKWEYSTGNWITSTRQSGRTALSTSGRQITISMLLPITAQAVRQSGRISPEGRSTPPRRSARTAPSTSGRPMTIFMLLPITARPVRQSGRRSPGVRSSPPRSWGGRHHLRRLG